MTEQKWHDATVSRVELASPAIKSFFLRAPLGPRVAGQHVDVRLVAEDGYEARRSYSIACAPEAEEIELMIEKLVDGEVSPWFHDVVVPGDTIEVRGPLGGHFTWRRNQPGPLLLIAGGSGIAPLMAMLRTRARRSEAEPVVPTCLLYSARTHEDLVYLSELQGMAATDTDFDLRITTTREPPRRHEDDSRRVDQAMLEDLLAAWGRTPADTYVCGSTGFVETVANALVRQGTAAISIRTERYGGVARV